MRLNSDMIRIEKACIELMLSLKKGELTKSDLNRYKEIIFKTAIYAACGEEVWEEIIKTLDKQ